MQDYNEGTDLKFARVADGIINLHNDWVNMDTDDIKNALANLKDMLSDLEKDFK